MELAITRAVLARLREEADAAGQRECCGILLGRGALLGHGALIDAIAPARNLAPDPRDRFEIDPQALVDAHRAARSGGAQVIGYYHSHPSGRAEPSPTDQAMANRDGSIWAIVGREAITFWRDEAPAFVPVEWRYDG